MTVRSTNRARTVSTVGSLLDGRPRRVRLPILIGDGRARVIMRWPPPPMTQGSTPVPCREMGRACQRLSVGYERLPAGAVGLPARGRLPSRRPPPARTQAGPRFRIVVAAATVSGTKLSSATMWPRTSRHLEQSAGQCSATARCLTRPASRPAADAQSPRRPPPNRAARDRRIAPTMQGGCANSVRPRRRGLGVGER
jgi:hypothetical protein